MTGPMIIGNRYETNGSSLRGGMSVVLQCKDNVLDRKVAIKILPGGADQRRIRDELAALFKMRSKHVVQVYDVLTIDANDLAIVQEFIEGDDLFEAAPPTSAAQYFKLIWQIAAGIADIHDVGVIHRDIKPNNIKIDSEGLVKIFDFGLARYEGRDAATMGFVGTPGFAAPELHRKRRVEFTLSVDVYAFGATALYLGLRNLPGNLREQPPRPSGDDYFTALPFNIENELRLMLNACLDKDSANRPHIHDIRDTLAKYLLQNQHKALVVFQGKASYLDVTNRSVNLRLSSMGEVQIIYDGFAFLIQSVSGDVFLNNRRVTVGDALPGACVIALGSPDQTNRRRYITFDLSHPEIVL